MPGEPFPSVPQGAPTISGCARRRWGRKRQEEQEMSQLDLDSKQQYGRTTAEQCNEEETFWEPWPWEPDEEAKKPVWFRYVVCTARPHLGNHGVGVGSNKQRLALRVRKIHSSAAARSSLLPSSGSKRCSFQIVHTVDGTHRKGSCNACFA